MYIEMNLESLIRSLLDIHQHFVAEARYPAHCDRRGLYRYRRFYLTYPQIAGSPSGRVLSSLPESIRLTLGFTHGYLGQLNTYVNGFRKNATSDGDNPPVGLLLCTRKNEALMEYVLAGMDNALFVPRYQLQLPDKEKIEQFLKTQLAEHEHE